MSQEADPGSGYRRQGGGGHEERCRAIMEVQDELLQQKDALLKDIRVIQKRKIKEMEELYDIKLKKKEFEQELETTKQEIQKMDEQFVQLRQRRAELGAELGAGPGPGAGQDRGEAEVKIIDHKKSSTGSVVNTNTSTTTTSSCSEVARPTVVSPARAKAPPPPPYYRAPPRPWEAAPAPPQLEMMPGLQHSRRPSLGSAEPGTSPQLEDTARPSFQPYKAPRPATAPGYHVVPHYRDPAAALLPPYRDPLLLPELPPLPPHLAGDPLGPVRPTPQRGPAPLPLPRVLPAPELPLPPYADPRHQHHLAQYKAEALEKFLHQVQYSSVQYSIVQ